jgi:tetratricopeptide (TPR) repeat protein
MKKILLIILLLPLNLIGQANYESELEELYSQKKYQEIIDLKTNQDWNGKSYYYRAMAHYMNNDDDNTIKFMNIAIEKGPIDQDMYYYKAMAFFYKNEYEKSLPLLKKSIEILPNESAFYESLGEVFYQLKEIDSSYIYLKKATTFEKATIETYSSLAEICFELEKYNEALKIYEKIIQESDQNSEQSHLFLYNVSLIQQLTKEYKNAETNLNKILEKYPNDYQAKTKLIQILIAQNKYNEVYKYRDELYLAFKQKELPTEFNDRFCFEQFDWNENKVFGYENFKSPEDSKETLFNKHQFYIYDKNGNYLYQINSESSFAVRLNESITYVLALKNERGYQTFWEFGFKETNYKTLKKNVLKILNQEVKPGSSTIIN